MNDVTPTLLRGFGLPVADDMAGVPIANVEWEEVASIPTYDTKPIPRVEGETSGAEDRTLEDLRQLEYIE